MENKNELRNNILCWYPFTKDCKLLEIYIDFPCTNNALFTRINYADFKYNNHKYDYIILNGFMSSNIIKDTKKMLKDNGTLLVLIDNKLGISGLSKKQVMFHCLLTFF